MLSFSKVMFDLNMEEFSAFMEKTKIRMELHHMKNKLQDQGYDISQLDFAN